MRMRVRSSSPLLGIIARELALDISERAYCPDAASHIPGITNATADSLSRKYAPRKGNSPWSLPSWLARVPERKVPRRDRSYYRALHVLTASASQVDFDGESSIGNGAVATPD